MIAPDEHGRIAQALSIAKKRYTLSVFPVAGHGFLSATRDSPIAGANLLSANFIFNRKLYLG